MRLIKSVTTTEEHQLQREFQRMEEKMEEKDKEMEEKDKEMEEKDEVIRRLTEALEEAQKSDNYLSVPIAASTCSSLSTVSSLFIGFAICG